MISRLYDISRLIIGFVGIVFAIVSLIPLYKTIKILTENKAYFGNELYLAVVVLTSIICAVILTWSLKTLILGFRNIKERSIPVPSKFEDFGEVAIVLEQKQLPPREKLPKNLEEKDKSFMLISGVFLGLVLVTLLVKEMLSKEFFWDFDLTPRDFSLPVFFTGILVAAVIVRGVSILVCRNRNEGDSGVFEIRRTIKTEIDVDSIAREMANALAPMQKNGNPAAIYFTTPAAPQYASKNTGQIHCKLFIETQPKPASVVPQIIVNLYLLFTIILYSIGFIFLVQLPPDNISVLTVPSIALGYAWTLVKGGVMVICATGFSSAAAPISRGYLLQSVMLYIKIDGFYEKVPIERETPDSNADCSGGPVLRGEYEFTIYTTELVTEFIPSKGRQITKILNNKNTVETARLATGAIDASALVEDMNITNLPALKEEK